MSSIPKEIKHSDLLVALEPLMELLGVTAKDIYARPGLIITAENVEFAVHAGARLGDRRRGVIAGEVGLDGPFNGANDELAVFVRVKTDLAHDSSVNQAARSQVVNAAPSNGRRRGK